MQFAGRNRLLEVFRKLIQLFIYIKKEVLMRAGLRARSTGAARGPRRRRWVGSCGGNPEMGEEGWCGSGQMSGSRRRCAR